MSETTKLPNNEKEQQGPDASRTSEQKPSAEREQHLDKTIADSFPSSDPPSTIPNPA